MRNREALRRELLEQIEHIGAWEAEDPAVSYTHLTLPTTERV